MEFYFKSKMSQILIESWYIWECLELRPPLLSKWLELNRIDHIHDKVSS
jgi:hypothetical protein